MVENQGTTVPSPPVGRLRRDLRASTPPDPLSRPLARKNPRITDIRKHLTCPEQRCKIWAKDVEETKSGLCHAQAAVSAHSAGRLWVAAMATAGWQCLLWGAGIEGQSHRRWRSCNATPLLPRAVRRSRL